VAACKFMFDPAIQAYLSDRTPYSRRGLIIAFIELGWSGAALVGLPLVGFLIARSTWRAPFLPAATGAWRGEPRSGSSSARCAWQRAHPRPLARHPAAPLVLVACCLACWRRE
jgi:MFS family permease